MSDRPWYVYVIHMHKPLGGVCCPETRKKFGLGPRRNGKPHYAQHYCGITPNLPSRMKYHARGRGSHFTKAAWRLGIGFTLVRVNECATKEEAAALEKKLKNPSPAYACPLCRPDSYNYKDYFVPDWMETEYPRR